MSYRLQNSLVLYMRIWVRLTLGSFQTALISHAGAVIFIFAKFLRFILFLLIVILVVTKTKTLAGYTLTESLIFFLTFNVIDTVTQLMFRDVYRFRPKIVSGDFDLILANPLNPLFRILLGGADPLDLVMLVPYVALLIFLIQQIAFTAVGLFVYVLLVINAFFIATAFHVSVLALGILTTEIDHAIMIYRDIESMARFPIDIYREPLRGVITFIIPVGIMMTFPPKALFGELGLRLTLIAFFIGGGFLLLSLKLWQFALTQYTSASS